MVAGCLSEGAMDWICIQMPDEHPDSERFLHDCERYLGIKIQILSAKTTVEEIVRKKRFLNSPFGAACTGPLKREVRAKWEAEHLAAEDDVTYVWGFDKNEGHRAERMIKAYPQFRHEFPLIENNLTKADCHGIIKMLGLKRPAMYDLGFPNNNCIGCLKSGMGTWNLVRDYFPEMFERRAQLEREIGHSCLKKYFLDELPADAGRKPKPIGAPFTLENYRISRIICEKRKT